MTDTLTTEKPYIEISKPGQMYSARIHAAGCADIRKDRKRGYTDTYEFGHSNMQDYVEDTFGDVASDHEKPNTEAWTRECFQQASEITVCACAIKTGFTRTRKEAAQRVDIFVSYDEKDEAKALGARWDADKRTWYMPNGIPSGFPEKWLKPSEKAELVKFEIESIPDGFYVEDETIIKIITSPNSGRQYGKQLVSASWCYAPGLVKKVQQGLAIPLTLDKAKELGQLYGRCVMCGATLTDESSIAAGIGPICATKF
ncbi:hypothetical protein PP301_gp085 [Gordonia phage GMA2]|uniref:DUF5710 domain-containing protein n=1 Tax=Gordonia phage GMA2 TaxID=1647283 RepID=A0A0K0N7B5_9CAUD|nr:hypothetical protein PP301_gp085 [Gordonia phage GMA2]AKJ72637.1 hypothetical protein GMA2_99 [Gordonia phage GMA2]